MTAVEWLIEQIDNKDMGEIPMWVYDLCYDALEMEKEQRQKVDKLLDTLLENNMCSHAGDKLIEQFKTDNQ
jgi:hypothetical protein